LELRLSVLIAVASLLFGCVKSVPVAEQRTGCVSCHIAHYAEAGACDDCHRGQPSSARKELAHARLLSRRAAEHGLAGGSAVKEGRALVEAAACRRCHIIGGAGTGLAVNLDGVAWNREQADLVASIQKPVENMPAFGFDRPQAEALIAFLLNSAPRNATEETYRVQFARDPSRTPATFDQKCGGCHRLLTPLGPLGRSQDGPNLSGLLTEFYPMTAALGHAWSEKTLREWVANPRSLRRATIMPPVALTSAEFDQVMDSLGASGNAEGPAVRSSFVRE